MKIEGYIHVISADAIRYELPPAVTKYVFTLLWKVYKHHPEFFSPEDLSFIDCLNKHFYNEVDR